MAWKLVSETCMIYVECYLSYCIVTIGDWNLKKEVSSWGCGIYMNWHLCSIIKTSLVTMLLALTLIFDKCIYLFECKLKISDAGISLIYHSVKHYQLTIPCIS